MSQEYFRSGRYVVTGHTVRAWNRSIQLDTIEGVDVGRPLFLMALAVGGGSVGLGLMFGDLLYVHEIGLAACIGFALLVLTWSVGSLRVYSKLTGGRGWAVLGRVTTLQQMRSAIEQALTDQRGKMASRSDFVSSSES